MKAQGWEGEQSLQSQGGANHCRGTSGPITAEAQEPMTVIFYSVQWRFVECQEQHMANAVPGTGDASVSKTRCELLNWWRLQSSVCGMCGR